MAVIVMCDICCQPGKYCEMLAHDLLGICSKFAQNLLKVCSEFAHKIEQMLSKYVYAPVKTSLAEILFRGFLRNVQTTNKGRNSTIDDVA